MTVHKKGSMGRTLINSKTIIGAFVLVAVLACLRVLFSALTPVLILNCPAGFDDFRRTLLKKPFAAFVQSYVSEADMVLFKRHQKDVIEVLLINIFNNVLDVKSFKQALEKGKAKDALKNDVVDFGTILAADITKTKITQAQSNIISEKLLDAKNLNFDGFELGYLPGRALRLFRGLRTLRIGVCGGNFRNLAHASKLESLILSASTLSKIPDIPQSRHLKSLVFYRCGHNGQFNLDAEGVAKIEKSKISRVGFLYCQNTTISGKFADLLITGLEFKGTRIFIDNEATFQKMKNLESLSIESADLDAVPDLTNFTALTELSLRNNPRLGLKATDIPGLKNVTRLDLSYCGVDILPNEVETLEKLKELDLSSNLSSGTDTESLFLNILKIPNLETLRLKSNSLTRLPAFNGTKAAKLVELDLSYNYITALKDSTLSAMPGLTVLMMRNNSAVGGVDFSEADQGLASLVKMNFENTGIVDVASFIRKIQKLKNFEEIIFEKGGMRTRDMVDVLGVDTFVFSSVSGRNIHIRKRK